MNGRWYGTYEGTNSGQIVVEVDDMGDHFGGCAYVYERNASLPSTFAILKTPNKRHLTEFKAPLHPVDPDTGEPGDWRHLGNRYPGVIVSKEADVTCLWAPNRLVLKWQTDIGNTAEAHLLRSQVREPSAYEALALSWQQFKEHVMQLEHYRYIYRGQNKTLRLCTPFHRTGRGDMQRFLVQDIQTLHAHLSARTRHFFNLRDSTQNASFFHLIQHHGYPTPLLDWTYSPFVAAYFAYRRVNSADAANASDDQKVRIFVFDKIQWVRDFPQILNTWFRLPHFSILEPVAIENERMVPQQALSSFTSVDDIEGYIRTKETPKKSYLKVIDLPLRERDGVIRELRLMGITAGSLFPGLDGACEELRERFFGF
jgi:hypothetical protein